MLSLYQVDGKRLVLNFHPGQQKAWDSPRRFVGIVAGTQGGKTSFCPLWLWKEILSRGPGDYGFVCPTFTLMELKALPEFRRFFETTLRLGSYAGSPTRKFTFSAEGAARTFGASSAGPTTVYFGYAENPDSLESATFKAAVLDEAGQKAFKRGSWEAILRRLALHQGRALIATTPYESGGWLRTEIYDRWKAGDPNVDFISFASTLNPAFPVEEFRRAEASLPRWKFDLFYRGVFARPAGLIYDCFEEAVHVVPRFTLPESWPRYVGLDFGGTNTAAVFLAKEMVDQPGATPPQPTGRFFVYREYKAGGRTAKEHVAEILKGEPRLPTAVGGSGSEDQWRAEFRAARLPVREPPVTGPDSVEVGINRVYGAVKRGELLVMDDLSGLIGEFGSYSREVDDQGNVTEKIEDKETYHHLDALRYIISYLKGGASGGFAAGGAAPDFEAPRPRPWEQAFAAG